MDNDGIGNEDNGGIRNKDNGGFRNKDNDRDVLNEYILEQMRLEDASGDDDDEVSVGDGPGGGGGGVDEAVAVAVMEKAVGPPLLPDKLADVNIVSLLVVMMVMPMTMFLNWQFNVACCQVRI
jgi:hypothetical protein